MQGAAGFIRFRVPGIAGAELFGGYRGKNFVIVLPAVIR
jgi:hypothetical protein